MPPKRRKSVLPPPAKKRTKAIPKMKQTTLTAGLKISGKSAREEEMEISNDSSREVAEAQKTAAGRKNVKGSKAAAKQKTKRMSTSKNALAERNSSTATDKENASIAETDAEVSNGSRKRKPKAAATGPKAKKVQKLSDKNANFLENSAADSEVKTQKKGKAAGKKKGNDAGTPENKQPLQKKVPAKRKPRKTKVPSNVDDEESHEEERRETPEPVPAKKAKTTGKAKTGRTLNDDVENSSEDLGRGKTTAAANKTKPAAGRRSNTPRQAVNKKQNSSASTPVRVRDEASEVSLRNASLGEETQASVQRSRNSRSASRVTVGVSRTEVNDTDSDTDPEDLEDEKEILFDRINRVKRDLMALKLQQQIEGPAAIQPSSVPRSRDESAQLQQLEARLEVAADLTGLKPTKFSLQKDPSDRYLRHGYVRGTMEDLEFIMTFDNPIDRTTKKGRAENLHVCFPSANNPPGLVTFLEPWEECSNFEQCLNLMKSYQEVTRARQDDLKDLNDFYEGIITVSTNEDDGDCVITIGDGEKNFFEVDWCLSRKPAKIPGTINYTFRLRLTEQGSRVLTDQQLEPQIILTEILKNPKNVIRSLAEMVKDTI